MRSLKDALRRILPSSDSDSDSDSNSHATSGLAPPPSNPVITVAHIYAANPFTGTLIKYRGPLLSVVPLPFTGGNLRYSTDGSAAYRASLADLVRAARVTLLFVECSSPAAAAAAAVAAWDLAALEAEAAYEAGNGVECGLLPLLNIQSEATDMGSPWIDMSQGRFVRELWSLSAKWGANLACLVRWKAGRLQEKPLPPLPNASDGGLQEDAKRLTIWPGPNAPRYSDLKR